MTHSNGALDRPGAGAAALIEARPVAVFWGFLALHVGVWTVLPALANPNLPLDVIEGLAWGREWQLGYAKHPPLSPWLMEAFAALGRVVGRMMGGGPVDWPLYLLSQVAVGIAFWAMWRLAREWLAPVPALLSVLLLEGIYYHNFTSPEFNANVVLLPFWALAIWALHRALRDGSWLAWAGWGLAAGLGMAGKYYTAVLLVAMAALVLTTPAYRRRLAQPGPYIGVAVFVAVILPHVVWLVDSGFPSFVYAVDRAASGSGTWVGHLVYPLRFFIGQAPIAVPALIMLLALGRLRRHRALDSETTRFLLFIGFGPLLATMVLSAVFGFKVRSMWGTPLFLTSGIMLVGWFGAAVSAPGLRRFAWAWSGIFGLAVAAYLGTVVLRPLFYDTGKRTHFPGRQLAAAVTAAWHERFDSPLPAVIGDAWTAGNLAYYSPDRPAVYIDAEPAVAPWLNDARVRASGAVVVWLDRREDTLAAWQERFGPWQEQPPLSLPWQTWGDVPPITVGWAIIPPR